MRSYVVRPGDSPAKIAIEFAGCPKCAVDLVHANPHKGSVVYPNGFASFKSLVAGEKLNLPSKWFDGSLDMRPKAYFVALPYADGVTPSMLGAAAAGILGDYATLDQATMLVGTLSSMDDQSFAAAVPDTVTTIDASVKEAASGSNTVATASAEDVQNRTATALKRNTDLIAAITADDQTAATQARLDVQNSLSSAIASARVALQAFYGDAGEQPLPASTDTFPWDVSTTAQAAASAIGADPNYCQSVAQSGTLVNTTVHAFKTAWNSSQTPAVPVDTGNYEQATATALTKALGAPAPAACATHAPLPSTLPNALPPQAPPPLVAVKPPQKTELSTAAVASIGLIGAGALGGVVYLATRKRKRKRR